MTLIRVFDGLTLCNYYTDESVPMGTIAGSDVEADGTMSDGQSKNDPLTETKEQCIKISTLYPHG